VKRPAIYEIVWDDACLWSDTKTATDAATLGLLRLNGTGYLVARTKTTITLAEEWCGGRNEFRHIHVFPLSCTRRVRRVDRGGEL